MGEPATHSPVLRILASFSRHETALDWARTRAEAAWGPVWQASPRFEFRETEYYTPSMGGGLWKQFLAFERLAPADDLPNVKRATNAWEVDYAQAAGHAEERPLNLDPGYITVAKLVLASTKDFAHRIYLRDGIYAEITLAWRRGGWASGPYTFPDYQRADYQAFFTLCREELRRRGG